MPEVTVRNWRLNREEAFVLVSRLPMIVAESLHIEEVEEAHLTAEDIEVFYETGDTQMDIAHSKDFTVRIEAMYFPEREARRNEMAEMVKEKLSLLTQLAKAKFHVWIVLPVAGFAEN